MNFAARCPKPSAPSNQRRRLRDGRQVVLERRDASRSGLVPLRLGTRALGILATAGRAIEPDTLGYARELRGHRDRAHSTFSRSAGRRNWPSAAREFKSALLASLAHDLRTPLTTIRVAASNLHASWLTDVQRDEQADLVVAEVERLTRLFQNILEMTRIEAGAVVHA